MIEGPSMAIEARKADDPMERLAEWIKQSAEDDLRRLEDSVRDKYLHDPLFVCQVRVGASILEHLIQDIDPRDAMRASLLVIAASQQDPL